MAATIPIQARIMEKMLTIPPRILGENDKTTPMIPKAIAIMASRNPEEGLTKKLTKAATIAMIDGMLKCGLTRVVCMYYFTAFWRRSKVGKRLRSDRSNPRNELDREKYF